LYPFKKLIEEGLASMMVAHLYIPVLDNTANQASTLSPKIVNGLLKDSLGFEGLIFTDA
jgi:beta-N-acetylhexosaminidase